MTTTQRKARALDIYSRIKRKQNKCRRTMDSRAVISQIHRARPSYPKQAIAGCLSYMSTSGSITWVVRTDGGPSRFT